MKDGDVAEGGLKHRVKDGIDPDPSRVLAAVQEDLDALAARLGAHGAREWDGWFDAFGDFSTEHRLRIATGAPALISGVAARMLGSRNTFRYAILLCAPPRRGTPGPIPEIYVFIEARGQLRGADVPEADDPAAKAIQRAGFDLTIGASGVLCHWQGQPSPTLPELVTDLRLALGRTEVVFRLAVWLAASMLRRVERRSTAASLGRTYERTGGPTSNGGSYSITYWLSRAGLPTSKELAVRACVVEYDDADREILRTWVEVPFGGTDR